MQWRSLLLHPATDQKVEFGIFFLLVSFYGDTSTGQRISIVGRLLSPLQRDTRTRQLGICRKDGSEELMEWDRVNATISPLAQASFTILATPTTTVVSFGGGWLGQAARCRVTGGRKCRSSVSLQASVGYVYMCRLIVGRMVWTKLPKSNTSDVNVHGREQSCLLFP